MTKEAKGMNRRAFLGGAAAFGAVCLSTSSLAFATPLGSEKILQANEVRRELIDKQFELEELSIAYHAAIESRDQAVASKEAAQARIDEINTEINAVQEKLSVRARSMYRTGGISFFDVLFASHSFEEFATNWDVLDQMNQEDTAMIETSKDLRAEAEKKRKEAQRQETIAEEKTADALVMKLKAEETVAATDSLLQMLDKEAREILEAERRAAEEAAARYAAVHFTPGGTDIEAKDAVIAFAETRLGCPYVWGATGPNTFDCSGLTSWSYKQIGMWITRTTETQLVAARAVLPMDMAERGDVIYRYGHVGLATEQGGNRYIHAPQTGDVVKYSSGGRNTFTCALRF